MIIKNVFIKVENGHKLDLNHGLLVKVRPQNLQSLAVVISNASVICKTFAFLSEGKICTHSPGRHPAGDSSNC